MWARRSGSRRTRWPVSTTSAIWDMGRSYSARAKLGKVLLLRNGAGVYIEARASRDRRDIHGLKLAARHLLNLRDRGVQPVRIGLARYVHIRAAICDVHAVGL